MARTKSKRNVALQVRSEDCLAMNLRNGDGRHGKVGRSKNRADRKASKQQLRRGEW